jgi:hypothetical protein
MNVISRVPFRAVAIALLLVAGCSESNEPAKPGFAAVSLVTPQTDDGAILLSITGPGISDVKPATSAYSAYWRVVSPTEARVIVLGNLSSGVLATFGVPDVRHVDQYSVTVLEVANRSDAMRTSTSAYHMTVGASH